MTGGKSAGIAVSKQTAAGFWIRVLARIIDRALGLFIFFIAGMLVWMILNILSTAHQIEPGWQHRFREFSIVPSILLFGGDVLYHFFCEGIHGATLGKLCCGLRVVNEDGTPSRFRGALIRSLAYAIDSLFFGAAAYTSMKMSPLNQRYGDVWGKTAVLKEIEISSEAKKSPLYFLLGLLLGLGSLLAFAIIGWVLKFY